MPSEVCQFAQTTCGRDGPMVMSEVVVFIVGGVWGWVIVIVGMAMLPVEGDWECWPLDVTTGSCCDCVVG